MHVQLLNFIGQVFYELILDSLYFSATTATIIVVTFYNSIMFRQSSVINCKFRRKSALKM
jgi:hypothetical protein